MKKSIFKLRIVMSVFFMSITIPFFLAFIFYSYYANLQNYEKHAKEILMIRSEDTVKDLKNLFHPIDTSLRILKRNIESVPSLLNSPQLNGLLLDHLQNNPKLISVFIATTDGQWKYIQNSNQESMIAGRMPPKESNFCIWNFDKSKTKESTVSTYTFYKDLDNPIESFEIKNNFDARIRPYFKNMLSQLENVPSGNFVQINDPYIALVNRKPTFLLATPIILKGKFVGLIAESFEISTISDFLVSNKTSSSSETYIINASNDVMVRTNNINTYHEYKNDGLLGFKKLQEFNDSPVGELFQGQVDINNINPFDFINKNNVRYLVKISEFPIQFDQQWKVLNIAPIEDFLADLKRSNNELILFSLIFIILLMLGCYYASKSISKPIENIIDDLGNLMVLKVAPQREIRSITYELMVLNGAINKLKTTLNAFISYVPRGLVNDLLSTGKPIEAGGESRYLTMLFSDLKDFSVLSESTPSREVLRRVSLYLELFTIAINEEAGTVDKFIGDSVMAFWGAPLLNQNHAYLACVAAIKARTRMIELNKALLDEGYPPLVVRVGIHTDSVLVGNIGSVERMSYTVMGDGVNIASRLEGINKEYATSICVSHNVYKEAGERLWLRPIEQTIVKGRKGSFLIYELLGIRDGGPETIADQRMQRLCKATEIAFNFYSKEQYPEAIQQYQQIIDEFDDQLSKVMISKCYSKQHS
jgi:adenylate cyclase